MVAAGIVVVFLAAEATHDEILAVIAGAMSLLITITAAVFAILNRQGKIATRAGQAADSARESSEGVQSLTALMADRLRIVTEDRDHWRALAERLMEEGEASPGAHLDRERARRHRHE